MSGVNANNRKKVKFFQSIPVQILFFNILMLLVFNVVSYVVNDGISSMTESVQNIMSGVTSLIQREGQVKEDIAKIDGTIQSAIGLWAYYGDEEKQKVASNVSAYVDEITSLEKSIGDEFAQYGDSTATTQLQSSSQAMIANVKEVMNIMMTSGDGQAAAAILTGEYVTNMEGVKKGFDQLDTSVTALQGNVSTYISQQRNKITMMNVVGMVIFIICLLLNLYVSFVLITKVIIKISNEVQGIIGDINAGKGDLTSRIKVKTGNELVFIRDGINEFIETLQGVMKDVKNGTLILTDSADKMTSQIALANDNITNTSAALQELSASMDKNKRSGDLKKIDVEMPSTELELLKGDYNSLIDHVNELIVTLIDKEKTLQKAQMRVLQEQIKPHFLYNSIETIGFLALDAGADKVHDALETLGSFYRNFLSKGDREIPLSREIYIVKDYLALQKLRYGDIIEDEYDIAEDTMKLVVPKLILQPLVENSIYHGIRQKGEPGVIRIKSYIADGCLHLSVRDTGVGMSREEIERVLSTENPENRSEEESFGLWGTIHRMRIFEGKDDIVRIESEIGEYTEVEFVLDVGKSYGV